MADDDIRIDHPWARLKQDPGTDGPAAARDCDDPKDGRARADLLFGLVDPQRQAQRRAAPAARHSPDVFGPGASP
jgi:hypothetical protein